MYCHLSLRGHSEIRNTIIDWRVSGRSIHYITKKTEQFVSWFRIAVGSISYDFRWNLSKSTRSLWSGRRRRGWPSWCTWGAVLCSTAWSPSWLARQRSWSPGIDFKFTQLRWIQTKKLKSRDFPESSVKLRRCVSDSIAAKLAGSTLHDFAATRPYIHRMLPKDVLEALLFYFYPIILNGQLRGLLILSIDKQPITYYQNNFWIHFLPLVR